VSAAPKDTWPLLPAQYTLAPAWTHHNLKKKQKQKQKQKQKKKQKKKKKKKKKKQQMKKKKTTIMETWGPSGARSTGPRGWENGQRASGKTTASLAMSCSTCVAVS
jgi:outer membrane biosynthesis protein TonB